jgi:hypothetical protein
LNTKLFGQLLLEKGYVTREQLLTGLREQRRATSTLGDLAVAIGMLSVHEVDAIRLRQRSRSQSFGQAAVNLGLLTERQVADLLDPNSAERMLLGQILVAYGYLDEDRLQVALKAHSGERGKGEPAPLSPVRKPDLSEIGLTCVSVMGSMYRKTTGTPVSCLSVPPAKAVSSDQHVWSQAISQGEEPFILGLQINEEGACSIARAFLRMPMDAFDDLVQDSVGEFLNLVTGHVCGTLGGPRVSLSPSAPAVQRPEDFLAKASPGLAVLCTGEGVRFTYIIARPAKAGAHNDPAAGAQVFSVPPQESEISLI